MNLLANFGADVTDIEDFDIDTVAGAATNSPRSSVMRGAITVAAQRYALTQTGAECDRTTVYPSRGTLRVRDAAGDFIDVNARDAIVALDL